MTRSRLVLGLLLSLGASWRPMQAASSSEASGVLLVELGVHVEPHGLARGRVTSQGASYDNESFFRQHATFLRSLATIVERHGGRATFQVQTPFVDSCTRFGDNVIGELAARGHEIALHFHEDAHLGASADTLPPERWIEAVDGQLAKIRALGVERVRMWSGALNRTRSASGPHTSGLSHGGAANLSVVTSADLVQLARYGNRVSAQVVARTRVF